MGENYAALQHLQQLGWHQGHQIYLAKTGNCCNSSSNNTSNVLTHHIPMGFSERFTVNNTDSAVTWNQVYENGTGSAAAGVHAELNVDNIGRFRVLS